MTLNEISGQIVDAAIAVQKALGQGDCDGLCPTAVSAVRAGDGADWLTDVARD
jgi:hypothetical protein